MRAGTSKGPFLDLRDLPQDSEERNQALLRIMGSPDNRQIDGIGGATPTTSKVVMVQPSTRPGIDVDYLFAQVFIDKPIVDTKPTCGNMMSGVAPFAIEKGWVQARHPETTVKIYNINTDSTIEMVVQTPNGGVNYTDGDFVIDGVQGTGAPILMRLSGIAGGATGELFPTGNRRDVIDGIEVSIVDAGNLLMLLKAEALGLNGTEGKAYFEGNKAFMAKIEALRLKAGRMAGLGDVSESVLPRISILSPPRNGGTIKSQYFTPHTFHPTHAVSGAICIGTATKAAETVASEIAHLSESSTKDIVVEHVAGKIPVKIEVAGSGADFEVIHASSWRTARKLMEGRVFF